MRSTRVLHLTFNLALALASADALAISQDSVLADLVNAQTPGSWMRVNANEFQSVWTPGDQRPSPGGASPRYVISAWSGGGYDSNTGDFYVWGGDNGTYSGNEVYRWTASSLEWERLSLPSAIANTAVFDSGRDYWQTVDGPNHAPISGETFDNVVYLPKVNRLAVIGGNAYPGGGLQYFLEDTVTRAGPFFFDPAKGDANKVGGLTGSQANAAAYPDVVGGNMWENRQSIETSAGVVGATALGDGASAVTVIDGKDVVFVSERGSGRNGRLFKYTVNSLDAAEDTWEIVGSLGGKTFSGSGAGAYDSTHNLFLRTGRTSQFVFDEAQGAFVKKSVNSLMFWDLNTAGEDNPIVPFTLTTCWAMIFR